MWTRARSEWYIARVRAFLCAMSLLPLLGPCASGTEAASGSGEPSLAAVPAPQSRGPEDLLREGLSSSSESVRLEAVRRFGLADPPPDARALLRVLTSEESPEVRLEALRVLRREGFRGAEVYESVSEALSRDPSADLRAEAAAAVLDYPGADPLAQVERLLSEEQGEIVREAACVALATAPAYASSPGATLILARSLEEDSSLAVRRSALSGLAKRGDRRALAVLQRASVSEKDEPLRKAIRRLLAVLSEPPKVEKKAEKKEPDPDDKALKGVDFCGDGNGWCECSMGPLRPPARCVSRQGCIHLYENTYMRLGYLCTWDGASLE